jgi:PAS domain S-box-containing protein
MEFSIRAHTRHYFISIFIIASVLFIAYSAVIYRHYSDAQHLNELTLYNYEVVRQSRRILMDLVDMETGFRGYVLSGEEKFLDPYKNAQKMLAFRINNLTLLTKNDEATRKDITLLLKRINLFSTLLSTQLEDLQYKGISGLADVNLDEQKRQMDELRTLFDNQASERLRLLQLQISKSENKQQNFRYIAIIGTILAIGGMLMGTLVIIALIRRSEKAEEEAQAIERRFMTVMNGINDGIYDFNLISHNLYLSSTYKSMLGYSDEEHPNTVEMVNNLLHPDDIQHTWEVVRQYQAGEIPEYRNIFRMRHKDGHWVWILSRGVGIRDDKGVMVRLLGTHTDITDQKNREEELTRLNKELENFTYIASHDLRAPLVNLKGFAGEMQHAIGKVRPIIHHFHASLSEEEQHIMIQAFEQDIPESLRFIIQSVDKMDALTTAVLDLSRIGKREYRSELVDTEALMKRCLDTLGYEISQKNIEVTCGYLPTIESDAIALEQIFSNILDNAVKYLDPARTGKISIAAKQMDNKVIFSIKDNGRGIAEADHEKIFQIFRRARNTTDIRGLGMGMTFVQTTLHRIKGSIWFESKQGVGSTFYISLPMKLHKKDNSYDEFIS